MALLTLASRVRTVTVYRRGALVTREAELVPGPEGLPTQVQIDALPLVLDDNSLRVELLGEGSLPVAGDVRLTIAVPESNPTLPPPQDAELDAAELLAAQLQRDHDDTKKALEELRRLEPGTRGKPAEGEAPQASPTAARLELLAFRRARAESLMTRLAELVEQRRLADERLATLRERKRIASQARNTRAHEVRKAAVLRLEPRGSFTGTLRIRLTYYVSGARWVPAYTIRLDRTMTGATLELRAMVGQNTGEDWTNVALHLSTALPQSWTELPELRAQKIGRRQPEPAKAGWRPPPVGAGELYADYDRDLAGRSPPKPPPVAVPASPPKPPPPRQFYEVEDDELSVGGAPEGMAREQTMTRAGVIMPPRSGGAPPPAPAAPGAMPMAPPMMSAGPMPMPQSRARKASMADSREMARAEDTGAGMPMEEEVTALELVAGRELLEYGRLRLFAANDHQRGALRRIEIQQVYRQQVSGLVEFDLAYAQLDHSLGRARGFESGAAPGRHHFPVGEAGFDYVYVADATIDLASDGKYHSLAIRADSAEATPRYVTVPRETQDVFRIVALRNPLQAPLLPGPADVYVDGRFALTSDVALTPIGGRLELGLGVEQAIKIARKVQYEEDTSGLIKRQIALIHTIEVTIHNNLNRAATVEVRERVPVVPTGLEGDIQFVLREANPKWEDFEQRQAPLEGGRMWKVEVAAGGERKLKTTWVVTIPNQHELVGGNRRES
jgi:hypothetical protein